MIQLSDKNIKALNTKKGIILFLQENLKPIKTLRTIQYESRMKKLQEELIKLQHWVVNENEKVVILFEGRDAAGKGGAIRRITEHLNPREFRVLPFRNPPMKKRDNGIFNATLINCREKGRLSFLIEAGITEPL